MRFLNLPEALLYIYRRYDRSHSIRELAQHLESIREKERIRNAREIHDDLGQALTVLKIGLTSLSLRMSQEQTELANE